MYFYDLLSVDNNTKIFIILDFRCPEMLNYSGLNAREIERKFEKEKIEMDLKNTYESYFKNYHITYINEFRGNILVALEEVRVTNNAK